MYYPLTVNYKPDSLEHIGNANTITFPLALLLFHLSNDKKQKEPFIEWHRFTTFNREDNLPINRPEEVVECHSIGNTHSCEFGKALTFYALSNHRWLVWKYQRNYKLQQFSVMACKLNLVFVVMQL
jgi:hypothetical protein